jgi:hypothetical protein
VFEMISIMNYNNTVATTDYYYDIEQGTNRIDIERLGVTSPSSCRDNNAMSCLSKKRQRWSSPLLMNEYQLWLPKMMISDNSSNNNKVAPVSILPSYYSYETSKNNNHVNDAKLVDKITTLRNDKNSSPNTLVSYHPTHASCAPPCNVIVSSVGQRHHHHPHDNYYYQHQFVPSQSSSVMTWSQLCNNSSSSSSTSSSPCKTIKSPTITNHSSSMLQGSHLYLQYVDFGEENDEEDSCDNNEEEDDEEVEDDDDDDEATTIENDLQLLADEEVKRPQHELSSHHEDRMNIMDSNRMIEKKHRQPKKVVTFADICIVMDIPHYNSYTPLERSNMWMTSSMIDVMVHRNIIEYQYEGGHPFLVLEEEDFVCTEAGNKVHPAHCRMTVTEQHTPSHSNNTSSLDMIQFYSELDQPEQQYVPVVPSSDNNNNNNIILHQLINELLFGTSW